MTKRRPEHAIAWQPTAAPDDEFCSVCRDDKMWLVIKAPTVEGCGEIQINLCQKCYYRFRRECIHLNLDSGTSYEPITAERRASVLEAFTLDDLLAEIVRRRNLPGEEQNAPWCHECAHYKAWSGRGDVPERFNPCSKKHRPQFWVPKPWESPENFGYYRTVCEDRKSIADGIKDAGLPPMPVR